MLYQICQNQFYQKTSDRETALPRSQVSKKESLLWFEKVSQPLIDALKDRDFLVENRFTAADVLTGGVLLWALKLGMLSERNSLKNYLEKLMARPAFKRADDGNYATIDNSDLEEKNLEQ